MDRYENVLHREYFNSKCHNTYKELLSKPRDSDLLAKAIEESLPVLGRVLGTSFRKIQSHTIMYEEILERVPFALYQYLISDTFYTKFYPKEESHMGFLWGLFRHEVLNALTAFRRSVPSRLPSYMGYPDYYSEFLPAAVEMGIFLTQLPQTIADDAEELIRFREDLDYAICLTVLEAIVQGKPIPWFTLRNIAPDYRLARIEFLVSHVRVLIRKVVLRYRVEFEQLQLQLSEEVQTVKDSIRASVDHTELNDDSDDSVSYGFFENVAEDSYDLADAC
jgi:hypothetical protein